MDFWSKRKQAVAEEQAVEHAEDVALSEAEQRAVYEEMSDEDALEALELPAPESLKEGDDFSVFMGKMVPDRLRRRALRCLWRSNPVLANVDGLVDYGQDFSDNAMCVENLQTAYQVGKGMLSHIEALAKQAEQTVQDEAEPSPADEASDDADDGDVAPEPPDLVMAEAEPPTPLVLLDPEPEGAQIESAQAPRPRRMSFRFGSEDTTTRTPDFGTNREST